MDWIIDTLSILPGIIIGLSLHEYAHAKMAIKLGDPTPKIQGRDTISPLSHIDPVGLACLMIAHFGWGKPVQIVPSNFKNPSKDQMKVAIAGPLMNLLIAFITLIVLNILYVLGMGNEAASTTQLVLIKIVTYTVLINISLAIFNLLPLPNFDGAKVLLYFAKGKWKYRLMELEKYGWVIFAIIVLTPIPQYIISPILNTILEGMQFLISIPFTLLGLI